MNRADFIKLFRSNSFICFPIPKGEKKADYRYKAADTLSRQVIKKDENYGVLPTINGHNCIVDFDNKELYRKFAKDMIDQGWMVIESPHGWHLPVVGIGGKATKIDLWKADEKTPTSDNKVIEIQGYKHYCVGAGSTLTEKDGTIIEYKNRGSSKIFDIKGKDFHELIFKICKECNVTAKIKPRQTLNNYRNSFKKGEPPTKGTSNDWFFQAALQCNTDQLTQEEAIKKLRIIYKKWEKTPQFSDRPWSNIEVKIKDVYEHDYTLKVGRPEAPKIDRTGISLKILDERKLYSDNETGEIFENQSGFLEKINDVLNKEIFQQYPNIELADYSSILFKLKSGANDMPETNKNLIVFKNGVFHRTNKTLLESDEIADMGFKNYDYLPPSIDNNPNRFVALMFDNVPVEEHPRVKAALKSSLSSTLDPKISVTHGNSGVGKSTGLVILVMILKDYALTIELSQLLTDHFIKAKVKNKRLLVLQDMPEIYRDFTPLKTLTGEQMKTERGFMQDSSTFVNKLKIWGTANYLAKIPLNEKNAMYTRRLSLIHNTRELPYPEDSNLVDEIVRDEGEKIISWILNLDEDECKYEEPKIIRVEWENLSSPEISYLNKFWKIRDIIGDSVISLMKVKQDFEEKTQTTMPLKQFSEALAEQGYIVVKNMIQNIEENIAQLKEKQERKQKTL